MSDVQTRIGISPVVTGGAGARSELRALWEEFKSGKLSVEEFNQEMRNTSGAIYAQRRVIMLMRTEYRNTRAALYEAMRGFRAVARIGRTITSTYMTYTLMQMRVADKTRDVRDTQEDLAKIQTRRIRVVKDLGATNAIALRLINEEERLTKRLTEDKRDLKRAQDQNIIGYVGIALQTLAVIPTMVSLKRHIDLTRLYLGESWSYTGLTGIVKAAGLAKTALGGILTTWGYIGLALAAPLVAKVIVEAAMETPYWHDEGGPQGITPPSMGGAGFDMWAWLGDVFGGMGDGDSLIPGDLTGALMDELGGLDKWADKTYGESTLPDINITVVEEEEDIDIQVDVTVTKTEPRAGGRKLR